MSAFYYFRILDIKDSIDINCFDDYKNYPLRIYVRGKGKVKTPAGKFKCLILEPKLKSSGIFLKKGKVHIWITDDKYKMPVLLEFDLPFLGHITCELTEYKKGIIVKQNH